MDAPNTFSSPIRKSVILDNLDRTPTSPPLRDVSMYPWNWGAGAHKIDLSPASSCGSPESEGDRLRRGRPRAENITNLMIEGTKVESNIRCNICSRVFPREKSLQAHTRTHTGERPYVCDYPGCGRAFCQSGQLKTHQRLHTGEKPFICSVEGCESRFTHANRHCIDHPMAALKRDDQPPVSLPFVASSPQSQAVQAWLQRYLLRRQERPSPARSRCTKRSLQQDIENQHKTSVKRSSTATSCAPAAAKRLLQPVDQVYADNCGVTHLELTEEDEEEQPPRKLPQKHNLQCEPHKSRSPPFHHLHVPEQQHQQMSEPKNDEQDRLLGALALVQLAGCLH